MIQLIWKEWRKTRMMFLLFVCLNLFAILITLGKESDLAAYLVCTLNSLFWAMLLPAVVFVGDEEQNSGEFTAALPISRRRVWSIRLFYIALTSLIFHGAFYTYALGPWFYAVYFALTMVAMVASSIFSHSFIIAFTSIAIFCASCGFFTFLVKALSFSYIPVEFLGVVAILLTIPFVLNTKMRWGNALVGLLFFVELFCIYRDFKMGQLHPEHHDFSWWVAEEYIMLIFCCVGICSLLVSYKIFVQRAIFQKITTLFIPCGTAIVCLALFFNTTYDQVEYRHFEGNIFFSNSQIRNRRGNLYDGKMSIFNYETKTIQDLGLYCTAFSYSNEYIFCWSMEFKWGLPVAKKYYVYNHNTKKKYDISSDFKDCKDVDFQGNRLLLVGKSKLHVFKIADTLQHTISYLIDKDFRFEGASESYAYFFRQQSGTLIKMNLQKREKIVDDSIGDTVLINENPASIVMNYIVANRFLVVEKRRDLNRAFWVKDLQKNTLKKVYEYNEKDVFFVSRLRINAASNDCIVRYYDKKHQEKVLLINMENGNTTKLEGRFLHQNERQFMLLTENGIQQMDFSTKKILYQQEYQFAPQRGYLLYSNGKVCFRSNEETYYYFDVKEQRFYKTKIPRSCYIVFVDRDGGIFYEDNDRKIYYIKNGFEAIN
ncbi:hypothetical protein [Candidatus Uabimicrobium amorphum]|uniref:Uncharacterized protein n=1 Tax=Uabimicrobium amorphum TaxID=2596890 RepID=A0A5S9F2I4_UABAM|nr:hypothetical protein [Candidatus Uabimicrobium amorphum]BBM83281.1 hypothetical protein UABAM_01632 [Candidatus Uabimicrobium amorphum]